MYRQDVILVFRVES